VVSDRGKLAVLPRGFPSSLAFLFARVRGVASEDLCANTEGRIPKPEV